MNQTKVIAIANQKGGVGKTTTAANPGAGLTHLVESIQRNGVMTPAMVRRKEDGRYELISGHRRCRACALAGLTTLKCEVRELTHDEAVIIIDKVPIWII